MPKTSRNPRTPSTSHHVGPGSRELHWEDHAERNRLIKVVAGEQNFGDELCPYPIKNLSLHSDMKNTPTPIQQFHTAPVVHVRSNWLPLCVGFVGWVILLVCSVGFLFLFHRYLRFPEDFEERNIWSHVLVALYTLLFSSGFYVIYGKYFPRQWMTEVIVNLEEKTIAIMLRGKTRVFPFSRINKGIYQGTSPIFTTHYMYWVDVEGERIPLVSFTKERESFEFYEVLERRAGLKMEQEPSNP